MAAYLKCLITLKFRYFPPIHELLDDVYLLEEQLDRVCELRPAGYEGRPELAAHLPRLHPRQVAMVCPVGGPGLLLPQVLVEVQPVHVVVQELSYPHREVVVSVDDRIVCQDSVDPGPGLLGVGDRVASEEPGLARGQQAGQAGRKHHHYPGHGHSM